VHDEGGLKNWNPKGAASLRLGKPFEKLVYALAGGLQPVKSGFHKFTSSVSTHHEEPEL